MDRALNWDSIADVGGDILDSRDIEELISELGEEKEAAEEAAAKYTEALEEFNGANEGEKPEPPEPMDPDHAELLKTLKEFRDDVGSSEWPHGLTLIAESYFEEYAHDLAEDIGAIPDDAQWPCTCIDWERAARELQSDYSSAELSGMAYYFLS